MKSKLLVFGLAIAALPAIAQDYQTHSYNKSVFSNFKSIRGVGRNSPSTIQKVQQHFPGMNVTVDKLNGSFTDIFGTTVTIPGSSVLDKVQYCFTNHLTDFGVNAVDWKLIRNDAAPKADFIGYEQYVNGHKVVFSKLDFRFTKGGKLQYLQMMNFGTPSSSLSPVITAAVALQAAQQDVALISVSDSKIESDWYWFPVPSATGYALRPAYAFNIKGEGEGIPVDLIGYVDAITGEVLYRSNSVKETITNTITGSVYKTNPLVPVSNEPLPNLLVTINGTNYYADTSGVLNITSLSAPVAATVKLQGLWSKVNVGPGTGATSPAYTPTYVNNVASNVSSYLFPTSVNTTSIPVDTQYQFASAYYHVNKVHDHMKKFYPSFTSMDLMLPTNVDITTNGANNCNAFYSGSSINFYAAFGTCNSFAKCGDIIYHEYGHGISDKFYASQGAGTIYNGALNEGNSDVWGMSITGDPVLGKGSMTNGGIIRRYDQAPKVYPVDIQGEVHADGEIIAGAWWDVAVNINSVDTMTQLFTDTYYSVPDGPDGTEGIVYHKVLIAALMSDDNDANLNNGTPHFSQIIAAFARHGIYLLGDANVVHADIPNQPANTAATITANLTMSTPAFFQALKLYYRTRGSQWDSLVMTNQSGSTFVGQIPGQAAASIVDYYFGVFDNTGTRTATFPGNYAGVPGTSVDMPYQFGVGLDAKTTFDFETPVPSSWTVGHLSGDLATNGIWIQAIPVGSNVIGASSTVPVQTGADHTSGAGMCLVTGNAPSPGSSFSAADVDGGNTSVVTGPLDISGFTDPTIEYWRWYTNNAGSNPGQDNWKVQIKDAASPIFLMVENTQASDNSWRRKIFNFKNDFPNLASSSKINLKFIADDAGLGSIVEAAVDDIVIYDKAVVNSIGGVGATKANIYPNPANNEINITLSQAGTGYVVLTDLTGKQVANINLNAASKASINTANIAPGVYFVTVKTETFIHSHKVTITH